MLSWIRLRPLGAFVALVIGPVLIGGTTSPAVVGPVECTTTAGVERCTTSFAFTGSEQTFVVPPGVTSMFVEVVGASGGGAPSGTLGGLGAVVDGTIVVTPGQTLRVRVGGVGAAGAGPATVAAGGFNGGGAGSFASFSGGGGGGASDVRTVPGDQPITLASRLVVAGAGGGASYSTSGPGGHAGQPGGSPASATPAQPGTSSAGGTGAPSTLGSSAGEDGSAGQGGRSGDQLPCCTSFGGGGGGAGRYGGGGGSGARGGAGGSSLVPDDGTATLAPSRGDGSVTLSWVILPLPTPPPAPAFTSAAVATFHRGQPGAFTITTSGDPRPMLQQKAGSLPAGLAFSDHGDGTATITGTPTGRIGISWLTMVASSQAGTAEQQLQVSVTLTMGACANRLAGTPGADTLSGSSAGDRLLGLGGDDRLIGRLARDCLIGGTGTDDLRGARGADTLQGRADADVLNGGAGRDRIRGGQGDDVIHARDGQIDDVRCGLGEDRVVADSEDQLSGCESKA